MRHLISLVITLACFAAASQPAAAQVVETDDVTYHLVLPKNHDAKKQYRLVVAVHGRTGTGQAADGEARAFAARGYDVIVAGPNMPWGSGPGKDKQADGDAAMAALLKDLRAKHKLHDKYVLVGFSQGGYFTTDYGPKHEDELLMAVFYGSAARGNWLPKSLPVGGACGSMEAFGDGIKAWGDKVVKAGGYAVTHIAEGAGHTVTDSMRKMTVDLYEKCNNGLHPHIMDEVMAKFDQAKKLEESQKFRDAARQYKSVLGTKGLPDDLKKQANDGQSQALLNEMAKSTPGIARTWDESRKAVLAAIVDFPGVLEFRKLLDEHRKPFRGNDLDEFFQQAATASQIISHITLHMKDVDAATDRGGKGPSQKLLNRRLQPLLAKIDDSQISTALDGHLKRLPEAVE